MKYEWDENKRQANMQKHGWDFANAGKVWESGAPIVERHSERKGEDRWEATGKLGKDTVFIVYEDKGKDTRRIISFRSANKKERQQYERDIGRDLGKPDGSMDKLFSTIAQELEWKKEPKVEQRPEQKLKDREDKER